MRYEQSRALAHLRQEGTMWGRSHHLVTMTMRKFEPIILDEDCAPRRVLELFSVKWTTMLLHSLHFNGGTCRTGTLARSLPGCSTWAAKNDDALSRLRRRRKKHTASRDKA